jgi:hypothetical protein
MENEKHGGTTFPEPLKVGQIVIWMDKEVGVVYEVGEFYARVQQSDGTKHRGILRIDLEPAPPADAAAYLEAAPPELQPEAIIKREAEERAAEAAFAALKKPESETEEEEED